MLIYMAKGYHKTKLINAKKGHIMKIISLSQVPKEPVRMEGAKDAYKQLVISQADGSPNFSFRVFTVEPGGHTPFHKHASEHLNYVIRGQGCLAGENGKEHEIREGHFALVLPNEKHQYRNTSKDQPLLLICAVPKEFE